MKALIQSYPPLGQVTTIRDNQVVFTAVLEISNSRDEAGWDVALWISIDDGGWREMTLARLDHDAAPQSLRDPSENSSFLYFSCSFTLRTCAQFTLKLRQASDRPWKWIRDEEGLNDGTIVLPTSPTSQSDDLRPWIPDLNTEWHVSSHTSQSPGTQLWSLDCAIPSSAGKKSAVREIGLGTPWGSFTRWFALVRHQPAWLGPRHGKSCFSLDQDALLCCFLSQQGSTMAMLAISGIGDVVSTFRDDGHGKITVHSRSDAESSGTVTVLISTGADFDHAVASVMYHARTMVSKPYVVSQGQANDGLQLESEAVSVWKPEWYDGLGFCKFPLGIACVLDADLPIGTWNALGQRLSEEKILHAVEELSKSKIRIANLVIDDNWQSLDDGHDQSQRGWAEFEADRMAFPNGLRGLVAQVRQLHPDIKNIMVWHALLGYWGGISPKGLIAKTYTTTNVTQEEGSRHVLTVVDKSDVPRFYDDFYNFLAESGIDGVKADAQVMIEQLQTAPDRRDLISTYLDAWSAAAQRYFGVKTISCMSQFPQAIFHSQLPRSRQEMLVRNSDDFFPDIPRSHPWHVWANAHNAILTQFLNAVPDWDMFQTAHDYSEFHAAARCVSGGPIYITDVPGKHNLQLIRQITATTPLGQTIILRPSVLGRSIYAYAGYEEDSLLKIGSFNGASQTGTGILGVFNVSTRPLTELIPLEIIPGVSRFGTYVVRAHSTGKTSLPLTPGTPQSLIAMSLDGTGYEMLCAFPVIPFNGGKMDNGHVCALGLVGKMTGCTAVTTSSVVQRPDGRVVMDCSIKALGTLGVYISTLERLNIEDDFMVAIEDQPVALETVKASEDDNRVLEIDVEKGWEQLGLSSMPRNEVHVKVSFQP